MFDLIQTAAAWCAVAGIVGAAIKTAVDTHLTRRDIRDLIPRVDAHERRLWKLEGGRPTLYHPDTAAHRT